MPFLSPTACLGYKKNGWAGWQNIEPDYQGTWRKPYQSYTVRCPQKMMKNITAFQPTSSKLQKKKKKRGKKSDDWQLLYSVEGGRIKERKKMRREWERLSERALAVGQITDVCGVHTDFMKLISKQQLEEKARQRHMRTDTEKGMRNEIYVIKEEQSEWLCARVCECVCVCVSMYIFIHSPAPSRPLPL